MQIFKFEITGDELWVNAEQGWFKSIDDQKLYAWFFRDIPDFTQTAIFISRTRNN